MSDFLKTMAINSAERASAAKDTVQSFDLDAAVFPLDLGNFDVIAEIKNRSPSEGALADETSSRGERAITYAQAGAAAISVLTEPTQFGGELAHLQEVVAAIEGTSSPVMRKDFLVDPIQILEARASHSPQHRRHHPVDERRVTAIVLDPHAMFEGLAY